MCRWTRLLFEECSCFFDSNHYSPLFPIDEHWKAIKIDDTATFPSNLYHSLVVPPMLTLEHFQTFTLPSVHDDSSLFYRKIFLFSIAKSIPCFSTFFALLTIHFCSLSYLRACDVCTKNSSSDEKPPFSCWMLSVSFEHRRFTRSCWDMAQQHLLSFFSGRGWKMSESINRAAFECKQMVGNCHKRVHWLLIQDSTMYDVEQFFFRQFNRSLSDVRREKKR